MISGLETTEIRPVASAIAHPVGSAEWVQAVRRLVNDASPADADHGSSLARIVRARSVLTVEHQAIIAGLLDMVEAR